MGAPVPDPVGLEGMCVRRVHVMRTVCVRGPCVCVVLGSVAQLAAGLCPTRLGVVDGRGSGCWLSWGETKVRTQVIFLDGTQWRDCFLSAQIHFAKMTKMIDLQITFSVFSQTSLDLT